MSVWTVLGELSAALLIVTIIIREFRWRTKWTRERFNAFPRAFIWLTIIFAGLAMLNIPASFNYKTYLASQAVSGPGAVQSQFVPTSSDPDPTPYLSTPNVHGTGYRRIVTWNTIDPLCISCILDIRDGDKVVITRLNASNGQPSSVRFSPAEEPMAPWGLNGVSDANASNFQFLQWFDHYDQVDVLQGGYVSFPKESDCRVQIKSSWSRDYQTPWPSSPDHISVLVKRLPVWMVFNGAVCRHPVRYERQDGAVYLDISPKVVSGAFVFAIDRFRIK